MTDHDWNIVSGVSAAVQAVGAVGAIWASVFIARNADRRAAEAERRANERADAAEKASIARAEEAEKAAKRNALESEALARRRLARLAMAVAERVASALTAAADNQRINYEKGGTIIGHAGGYEAQQALTTLAELRMKTSDANLLDGMLSLGRTIEAVSGQTHMSGSYKRYIDWHDGLADRIRTSAAELLQIAGSPSSYD